MSHPTFRSVELQQGVRLVVVQDQPQLCPYLPAETARMPLELPIGPVQDEFTDWVLGQGYRRSGEFVYRTRCPKCDACQPTRLIVSQFRWSKSFRRVLKRGDRDLQCRWQRPVADRQRVDLFNRHRIGRGLDSQDTEITLESYDAFLVSSFGKAEELSIWHEDRLVGVAIVDVGIDCLSAVYTHFEPGWQRHSLGTYAILKQIERALRTNVQYVYLGMYVRQNHHLNYKARFRPQERYVEGRWIAVDGVETQADLVKTPTDSAQGLPGDPSMSDQTERNATAQNEKPQIPRSDAGHPASDQGTNRPKDRP